ncbi:unnamed protein product [Staurois parvus]|uniref:Uncharacterized protein n=1 Tax=Staurois parvus TaxID=386267 RepID=A0ABN9GEY0_9NEOB|nr:unnamed protein product [Staurois parvus]
MTRDCGHGTGDDQRLRTQYRDDQRLRTRYVQGDDRRLRTRYRGMTGDCGHSTGDDQRLRTQYRRSQKTTGPFTKRSASRTCAVGTPGCEAASCHSRVPTLKMPAAGREDGAGTAGPEEQVGPLEICRFCCGGRDRKNTEPAAP